MDLVWFLPGACSHNYHPETAPRRLLTHETGDALHGFCSPNPNLLSELAGVATDGQGVEKEVLVFLAACVVNSGGTNYTPSISKRCD